MKLKTVIFAIFLTTAAANVAPRVLAAPMKSATSAARLLAQARNRYANISLKLSRYRVTKRNDLPACEGAELLGYFSRRTPRRLIYNHYAGNRRMRSEYSFQNGQLFFAHLVEEHYVEPLGWEPRTVPNGTVRTRTDERFYFHEGKLFRRAVLVRERKKPLRSSITNGETQKDISEAARVLADARDDLKIAKNPPRDK